MVKRIQSKGIFFSIDALIALVLLLSTILAINFIYTTKEQTPQPIYGATDIIHVLSTIKMSEISDPQVILTIMQSNITDMNKTIIEHIVRLNVEGKKESANKILNQTIGAMAPENYGLSIWIEGENSSLLATRPEQATQLVSAKRVMSGIEKNRVIEGVAARALISRISDSTTSTYTYFGGYEGDGNITKLITLPANITGVTSVYIELNAGGEFDLFVNGNNTGHFTPTKSVGADVWLLNATARSFFRSGNNALIFSFTGAKKYIGGGYIKVEYATSQLNTYTESDTMTYAFPGIKGIINVYSSLYIPGTLTNMSAFLHYASNLGIFLALGNTTVYSNGTRNSSGETTITLPDTLLRQLLNYSSLGEITTPLRIGVQNASYISTGSGGTADAVLVTDVSGSMSTCIEYLRCTYSCREGGGKSCLVSNATQCTGNVCGGTCTPYFHRLRCSKTRLDAAKAADRQFVSAVLNTTGNKVGLVSYSSTTSRTHNLSTNQSSLYNQIGNYTTLGGTCICCGIISATNTLRYQSNGTRMKSMLVMTDGDANYACGMDPVPDHDGDSDITDDPQDHTIQAACNAYANHSIIIYTVGFGGLSTLGKKTLNLTAQCGGGKFMYSNTSDITSIYQTIASEIVNLSYSSQTILASGEIANTTLFGDSFIQVTYISSIPPPEYNRIPVTIESPPFGNNITEGTIFLPNNVQVYDARLTSYSGDKWTHSASKSQGGGVLTFYNLSRYSSDYRTLGDPYIVNIPVNVLLQGTNTFRITAGSSPSNSSGGSPDNRLIYTAGVSLGINYTGVFADAQGCIWNITFEDNTNVTATLPQTYTGQQQCAFDNTTDCATYTTDAINNAVCQLFAQLDADRNGKLFVKFGPQDLDISASTISKIPYMWGPTTVEVRVWR